MRNLIKRILREEVYLLGEKNKSKTKKDACYHKVKARYDVWPSAYGSGALSKCRKVGAANWGKSTTKEQWSTELEQDLQSFHPKPLEEKRKLTAKPSSETSLRDWFGRKGEKGSTGGWVDCNSPDGKGGYKSCGRKSGEERKKYPACRPTPSSCKSKGKGKKWGKKSQKETIQEAEYQGRKVTLNKPTRGDVKKFKVYVKNDKGNVVKVNFGHGGTSAKKKGEKTMRIKKSNPARRKSFRARHNCDNPGPKTKARYWSCKAW